MSILDQSDSASGFVNAIEALDKLEKLVLAVKGKGERDSGFSRVLSVLDTLARKEDIPLAIVGGLGAIHHGYERLTKDVDIVVARSQLNVITRVAPHYGIKVVWRDQDGWHKFRLEGVNIDIVPEGARPRGDAPTAIPSPKRLGVRHGAGYAALPGWVETKLMSYRIQDQADVVQIMKFATPAVLRRIRNHLTKVHQAYARRFDELLAAAKQEKQQERERGGAR